MREEVKETPRVLVVDDNEQLRHMMQRLLRRSGYQCAIAADGLEARRLLEGERFDVVLCDLNMPGESGLGLLKHIVRHHPGTAVVLVTAVDDLSVAMAALELGSAGYIIKPFRPTEVLVAVAVALRSQRLTLENRSYLRVLERVTSLRSGAARRSALAKPSAAEGLPGLVETGDPQRLAEAAGLLGSQEGSGADEPQRVRQYVGLLADKLGMPPERSEILCTAAAIHDIGKLIIPETILLKPGQLTPQEFEVVKAHSTLGGSLLAESGSEVLSLAATIAWTHHERWDGNGYPRGLAGEEIPLEGRIVAIADVFDALISPRSYRPALTIDDAVRVLEEGRGSQFDPQILDLFLKSLDEVVEIAQDRSTK